MTQPAIDYAATGTAGCADGYHQQMHSHAYARIWPLPRLCTPFSIGNNHYYDATSADAYETYIHNWYVPPYESYGYIVPTRDEVIAYHADWMFYPQIVNSSVQPGGRTIIPTSAIPGWPTTGNWVRCTLRITGWMPGYSSSNTLLSWRNNYSLAHPELHIEPGWTRASMVLFGFHGYNPPNGEWPYGIARSFAEDCKIMVFPEVAYGSSYWDTVLTDAIQGHYTINAGFSGVLCVLRLVQVWFPVTPYVAGIFLYTDPAAWFMASNEALFTQSNVVALGRMSNGHCANIPNLQEPIGGGHLATMWRFRVCVMQAVPAPEWKPVEVTDLQIPYPCESV